MSPYSLRFTIRSLRRSPRFTTAVVATLSIGIGATCAMYTVIDRLLLRPIPFNNPSSLVRIHEAGKKGPVPSGAPYLDIVQWQNRSRSLQQVGFYTADNRRVWFLEGRDSTLHVSSASISANLFPMLGVKPELGRGFLALDDAGSAREEDAHGIILSHSAWQQAYGADPAVIGRAVRLNGEPSTIIGVMPSGIEFPYGSGNWNGLPVIWRPIVLGQSDTKRDHRAPQYNVLARLNPQSDFAAAESELKVIQADVAREYSDPYDRDAVASVVLQTYSHSLVDGPTRKASLALFGASALLWLIAYVNAASLMLARSTVRQREFAVRSALGASRLQILQQMLMETMLLNCCASLIGVGLATAVLKVFEHSLQLQFGIHSSLTPDLPVFAVLTALTILGASLVAVWPALGVFRAPLNASLRHGSVQLNSSRKQHHMRGAIVISQIVLSLTLLSGCGLMLRTLYALRHVSLGFRTDHILVANMTIPSFRFAGRNMFTGFYQPLIERVQQIPGVQSASLVTEVPLGNTFSMVFSMRPEGHRAIDLQRREMRAQFRAVGPEMQQVFGFRMLRGRFFNEGDTADSQAVVVVNRAFVRAYFGDDRDPSAILGEDLIGFGKTRRSAVVGVLDDERQVAVAEPSQPEMEVCIPQVTPESMFYKAEGVAMDIAVRTPRSPDEIIPELRNALRASSSELAASTFTTMDQVVEDSFGSQRLAAELLVIFAAAALILSLAGIYGLLAYTIVQRQRELGIRMALGAGRRNIITLVLRQAVLILAAGLGLGLVTAFVTTRWLRVFLYQVKSDDPWTMAIVAAVLFAGGLIASLIPARRASSVEPADVIRAE